MINRKEEDGLFAIWDTALSVRHPPRFLLARLTNHRRFRRRATQTLVRRFAPFGAAQIDARIAHGLVAGGTVTQRLILPEFDRRSAPRTLQIEDVLRFPIAHILSWAMVIHSCFP